MNWWFSLFVIALLVVFNFYVADGLIRMQRDLKQIQKLLVAQQQQPVDSKKM